ISRIKKINFITTQHSSIIVGGRRAKRAGGCSLDSHPLLACGTKKQPPLSSSTPSPPSQEGNLTTSQ
ncbi:MAG TPA: hypothetical protein VK625_19110, partial [Flavitalea sp.]|nr:hypothetical protein [Flavitalea sp.]